MKELCYCIWEETEVEKADYINPNVERLLASHTTLCGVRQ